MENIVFIPKNIEKRAKDLAIMQAKELAEFEIFSTEFQKNLAFIKDNDKYKKYEDIKEQFFIDLMKNCLIKTDQDKYPFLIFLFKDGDYMFQYNWKNGIFWCSLNRAWTVFEQRFQMSYEEQQQFILDQVETHYKFRPSTTMLSCASNVLW